MADKLVGCFRRPQLDTDIHSHLTRMLGESSRARGGGSLIKRKIRGVSCISLLRLHGVHFLRRYRYVFLRAASFPPFYFPFPFSFPPPGRASIQILAISNATDTRG